MQNAARTQAAVKRSREMEQSLELAHRYISRALQLDYLSSGRASSGRGQRQGTVARRPAPRDARKMVGKWADERARGRGGRDMVRQYLAEISTRARLSSSEEYRLVSAAIRGDTSARQRLIEHHLGLVTLLARRYRNRGLPPLDLIAEGNIGLMLAIRRFDPEKGFRFSTYAKWWIRQSIELALMTQTRVVRVPVYVTRKLRQSTKFLLYDVRHQARPAFEEADLEPDSIIERVAAPEHDQPEWPVYADSQRQQLEKAMLRLRDSERTVLRARFGLQDDSTRTLQSIARELNVSSERVRQIQAEALEKLRQILQLQNRPRHDSLL
jgi:RNA polymerase sigma factor (sigma-70 family)